MREADHQGSRGEREERAIALEWEERVKEDEAPQHQLARLRMERRYKYRCDDLLA